MDDLLREFLTETNESLDVVDVELVRFEQEPNNNDILANIFRLVHTIKGTCGFLGLPRLEALAHAAETLMGKFRDGLPVTSDAVSLILKTIDRIKKILGDLEKTGGEPEGTDEDLIAKLVAMSEGAPPPMPLEMPKPKAAEPALIVQALERDLRPGEVSLDDLERAFRETDIEVVEAPEPVVTAAPAPAKEEPAAETRDDTPRRVNIRREEDQREEAAKAQTLRVQVETLERLMTMVSELVLTRNQLLEIMRHKQDSEFKVPLQRLSNVTAELQEGVIKTRMQPIGNAWSKLPRIVRDLSKELNKEIELDMQGADTELDRQILEVIRDPLTHIVRNSADHGLETIAERRKSGKPDHGTIRLSAYHESGQIVIQIADDGRGLNTARIREKAIGQGLMQEGDKLSDAQIHKFIFASGFSTAATITNVSGRGVGMDVVKTNIDQIGGSIDLKSTAGKGTTLSIKIPLTLAIVPALLVESAKERFAIPQSAVVELVRVNATSKHKIERVKDAPVLRLRNKLLPLAHLSSLLNLDNGGVETDNAFIVVMQIGKKNLGIVVDTVFHTEEIVVKPMSLMLRELSIFSGNTILGDGSVIMIIDPNGLASTLGARLEGEGNETEHTEEVRENEAERPISFLVFRAGSQEPKAIPLSLITRLEEMDAGKIEQSNGKYLVQYRGGLMPLVPINDGVKVRSEGMQPLLVFIDSDRALGLVVDEIVDVIEDRLNIQVGSANPGTLGSAIIGGKATEILDVAHYLPLAYADWFIRKEKGAAGAKCKLLFVDDSAFFRNMLLPVLKAAGYDVTTASSGTDALEIIEREAAPFDAIVSDIEMPGMSGFELAETLRKHARFADVPIIALSSHSSAAVVERGRKSGFHNFVAKFDRQGLLTALKHVPQEISKAA